MFPYRQLARRVTINLCLSVSAFVLPPMTLARGDAAMPRIINILQHGATADDTTDDTASIQKAIDTSQEGDTVLFPPGVYYITRVGIKAGVLYHGRGATIVRPVLPDVLPDGTAKKWVRTFDTSMPGYLYSGDVDSAPTLIEGFTFYGNRDDQGAYQNYEQEQAHFIMLSADASRRGRLRITVKDCRFRESVADGVSTYTNVDAQILNCSSYNCFRGGCVITGGYSKVLVDGFTSEGTHYSAGVDVEVDGEGFGKTKFVDITLLRLRLWDGRFDIGVSDKSTVLVQDAFARSPFTLAALDSTVLIENSRLGIGPLNSYRNRFVFPGRTTIRNTGFVLEPANPDTAPEPPDAPNKWAAVHVYWNITGTNYGKQYLRFENCDFSISARIEPTDETHAVIVESFAPEDADNTIEFINCTVSHEFDHGLPKQP